MDNNCEIGCRWYLTMPLGAVPLFPSGVPDQTFVDLPDARPNGLLFTDRHTYSLGSAGSRSELDWFIIENISGGFVPQLTGSDDILTEKGITGYGVDPVLVRPSSRNIVFDILIQGENASDYQCIREELAYILSSDHLSAYNQYPVYYETLLPPPFDLQPFNDLPNANCNVNPYTITKECVNCYGIRYRKHIDIAGLWLNEDGEFTTSNHSLRTSMTGFVPDPRWYGDEICIPLSGEATKAPFNSGLGNGPPSHNNVNFTDPSGDPPANFFRYRGSARTGFTISIETADLVGVAPFTLAGINLFDVSVSNINPNWRRFRHIDWPNDGGWSFTGFDRIIFDTQEKYLIGEDALGIQTPLHPSMDASNNRSWDAFLLVPGRTYFIALEISDSNGDSVVLGADTELCYTERFMGV